MTEKQGSLCPGCGMNKDNEVIDEGSGTPFERGDLPSFFFDHLRRIGAA